MTELERAEDKKAIIRAIFEVISRKREMSSIGNYIDEELENYRDDTPSYRGLIWWCRWVRFLQFVADRKEPIAKCLIFFAIEVRLIAIPIIPVPMITGIDSSQSIVLFAL